MRAFWVHVDSLWPLSAGVCAGKLSRYYYYEICTDMYWGPINIYIYMAPTVVIMWLTSLGKIRAATAHDYGTFRVTRAKLTALRPPVAENVSSWPDTSTICLYIYIYIVTICARA